MRSPKVVGKSPEAKSLLLGFGSLLPHPSDIVFAEDALSRIMTFRFWHMVPIRFFKEGPCNPQIYQNAESSLVEAYSMCSPAHEIHMRHTCVPRCGHARSDAKSVAHMSKGTRGQNYTRAGRKFYQS